jgi:hypothetical protein
MQDNKLVRSMVGHIHIHSMRAHSHRSSHSRVRNSHSPDHIRRRLTQDRRFSAPASRPPAIPGPQPQPPRASAGVGTETAIMAIMAAAEKKTAAFIGFPFTKMVVDNENRFDGCVRTRQPERSDRI